MKDLGYKFFDPMTKMIFELGNTWFFKDAEIIKEGPSREFVFKNEYVDILIGVIAINLGLILNFGSDTNLR